MKEGGIEKKETGFIRFQSVSYFLLTGLSFLFYLIETDYMRVRPSLIAAASISAAINRLGLTTSSSTIDPSCEDRLLADLVAADAHQLASLVRSVESLMAAQLTSVQQQQQQDNHLQQQQQQQQQQQHPHVKNSKMQTATSSWELDVQPETPTDIQDIHF